MAARKTAKKKTTTRKRATTKKAAPKKRTTRKAPAKRKTTRRKPATRRKTTRRSTTRKSPARKRTATKRKTTRKAPAKRKTTRRKTAPKKRTTTRRPRAKATARKVTAKSVDASPSAKKAPKAEVKSKPVNNARPEIQPMPRDQVRVERSGKEITLPNLSKRNLPIKNTQEHNYMIRSVSPLRTPYAHSSRRYVAEMPETGKFPAVLVTASAFFLAVLVGTGVVLNFAPDNSLSNVAQTSEQTTITEQKVAGASTGLQTYIQEGDFSFEYDGSWYVSRAGNRIVVSQPQYSENSANTDVTAVEVLYQPLDGKTFAEWFSSVGVFRGLTTTPVSGSKNQYQLVTPEGNTFGSLTIVVGDDAVATVQVLEDNGDDGKRVASDIADSLELL